MKKILLVTLSLVGLFQFSNSKNANAGGSETIFLITGPDQVEEGYDVKQSSDDYSSSIDDDNVSASLVTDVTTYGDDGLNAKITTVFRGSAAGISSVFISAYESLEDEIATIELQGFLEAPTKVKFVSLGNDQYHLSFVGQIVGHDPTTGDFIYVEKSFTFLVSVAPNGDIAIDKIK